MKTIESTTRPPSRTRLDLFLKWSGLIKRRTRAKWMCDRQEIRVNGVSAKAGHAVAVGDRIEIFRATRATILEIVALPNRASARQQDAAYENLPSICYRILDEAPTGTPPTDKTSDFVPFRRDF